MSARSRKSSILSVFAWTMFAAMASAAPAFAQRLGGGAPVEVAWWRLAAAFALCVALALGGALVLRARLRGGAPPGAGRGAVALKALLGGLRQPGGPPPRRLTLVETVRLSHQVDICLLSCDEAEFIVATSPQGAFLVAGDTAGQMKGRG